MFSEYADLYKPKYYDLPGSDYASAELSTPQIAELNQSSPAVPTPISAMTFKGSSSSDSRLILSVSLLVGKRLIRAKALVDSGSRGDFINSSFAEDNQLFLSPRPFPLQCLAFDGTPSPSGEVTHFWEGRLTIIGEHNALFDAPIKLDFSM